MELSHSDYVRAGEFFGRCGTMYLMSDFSDKIRTLRWDIEEEEAYHRTADGSRMLVLEEWNRRRP